MLGLSSSTEMDHLWVQYPHFQVLPASSFWSLCRGRPGPFYHMSDINVYLHVGRQMGGGSPDQNILCMYSSSWTASGKVSALQNVQNSSIWTDSARKGFKLVFFLLGIPVYLGRRLRHSHDKMDQAFSLHFLHTLSSQELDIGKSGDAGMSTCCRLVHLT